MIATALLAALCVATVLIQTQINRSVLCDYIQYDPWRFHITPLKKPKEYTLDLCCSTVKFCSENLVALHSNRLPNLSAPWSKCHQTLHFKAVLKVAFDKRYSRKMNDLVLTLLLEDVWLFSHVMPVCCSLSLGGCFWCNVSKGLFLGC